MLDGIREIVLEAPGFHITVWGMVLGLIFGFVVYRTNYCAMGSISDIVSFGDYRRFRSWVLAGAVAMIGVYFLQTNEVTDVSSSMYLRSDFLWLGNVVGGLMFGFGMVFAGGCVTKNIVRAGSGDLRSLVVLIVTGLFAYMTIGGLLGLVRTTLFGPTSIDLSASGMETQSIGAFLSAFGGMEAETANLVAMVAVAAIMLIYCFKSKEFRAAPAHITAGLVIGLCVIAGWFLTGLASDEFADVQVDPASFTFVRPTGDTLEYLMRFTALGPPSFGVITLFGTLIGATIAAISMGRFRWSTFADVKDTRRNLFGAAIMGIGGVLAFGCTVGQSITGVSTLAIGSFITFATIVIGGYLGVHQLNKMLMADI